MYPAETSLADHGPFRPTEYGLPLTRNQELEPGGRALSTEVSDCESGTCVIQRKTYVEYQNDGATHNRRIVRQRVAEEQDTGCDGVCQTDTTFSDFDGYGHFRKSTTTSNFPSSAEHVTFANYNPGSSASGKDAGGSEYFQNDERWILGTYDFSWVRQGASATKTVYDFDTSTGVLRSMRRLKGGLPTPETDPATISTSANDLLTAYCRNTNTAGTRGFVTSERLFGGDRSSVPSAPCSATATRADGQYFKESLYTFDGADLTKRETGWADSGFLSIDVDLDVSTGLVSASRDSAGLETNFYFGTTGRITEVRPPEQGWTRYVYDPAATPRAKVETQVWAFGTTPAPNANPSTDARKDDYSYFDGFGRLILSKSRMPWTAPTDQRWAATKTEYDAAGRVKAAYTPVTKTTSAYENVAASKTTYTYDVFGRVKKVLGPDGSSSVTAYTGSRKRAFSFIEAGSTTERLRSTEEYDGRGRLIKVTEPAKATSVADLTGDDVTTTYGYDQADRLIHVKTVGAVDQERFFVYDNRGWLKSETHPEKGAPGNGKVTYGSDLAAEAATKGHDAAGLVAFRQDGEGSGAISTTYLYDAAQRLTTVTDGAAREIKKFVFAPSSSGSSDEKGKLIKATRHNYLTGATIIVTETYKYAELGGRLSQRDTKVQHKNTAGTTTTINEFSQTVEYEPDFGRPDLIGYPTCSIAGCATPNGLTSVAQVFDKGSLKTVTGFATLAYQPTGMVAEVTRATPATSVDKYVSDHGLPRPASVTFQGIVNCTAPSQPQIQSAASVCPLSQANHASVANPVPDTTYEWSISGAGTLTSTTGTAITFYAHGSGSITLSVVARTCASTSSAPRMIAISGPTASLQPGPSIDRGAQAELTVHLTGTPPWTLTWADGTVQSGINSATAKRFVTPFMTTNYSLSSVTDAACSTGGAVTGNPATVTVYPPSPAWVSATSNNLAVTVTWPASAGASSYLVERATSRSGPFTLIGNPTSLTPLTDIVPASANPITYVYRVRARDAYPTDSREIGAPLDFATTATVLFAESVTAGTTIKASYLAELRKAVDALRIASGLPALYGNAPSLAGVTIEAGYFTSIMNALSGARAVWGLSEFVYSGVPAAVPGNIIHAGHVTQLRDGVR